MRVGCVGEDRATMYELSERLLPDLVAPLAGGPGLCPRCVSWIRVDALHDETGQDPAGNRDAGVGGEETAEVLCENCVEVLQALRREPLSLSVISLYCKPSPLRDALTRYKGRDTADPYDPLSEETVRAMLGRYLLEHGDRLDEVSGGVDGIVVVPSTTRDSLHHPLEALVDSLALDVPRWSILRRGPGEMSFRKPSLDGYRLISDQEPSRILLVDDVYTTGSRLNSASAALTHGGHQVAAALVLARRINPDHTEQAKQMWLQATSQPFTWQMGPRTVAA